MSINFSLCTSTNTKGNNISGTQDNLVAYTKLHRPKKTKTSPIVKNKSEKAGNLEQIYRIYSRAFSLHLVTSKSNAIQYNNTGVTEIAKISLKSGELVEKPSN